MKRALALVLLTSVLVGIPAVTFAQYTSPSYKVEETFFGAGGELESTSPSFKAHSSLGGLGIDPTTGTAYKAFAGFLTPNEPFLEMVVNTATVNLGDLDPAAAATATATFHVRAYTNSGYTVRTIGGPLTSPDLDTITLMSTQAASSAGTEQFGINLRANTSPANFGADPSKQPDASFADGRAATGYDTANQFKYVSGDAIADTNTSGWGQTLFTISYIANVSPLTEAGRYSMTQDLVVVPTF